MLVSLVTVTGEKVFLRIMDSKVTKIKNDYDIVKNENHELKSKITSILSIEKLYKVAESNKYLLPKENEIIYLKND
jgi:hypothetical protein